MRTQSRPNGFLLHDVLVIAISVGVAVFLVRTEVLVRILTSARELEFLGSFIAGIFFRFIRDKFSEHLIELVGHRNVSRKMRTFFRLRLFRWLSLFVGGLIIASPLPDELGISLLGFSKVKISRFVPLSFAINFIGIVLIGPVARAI